MTPPLPPFYRLAVATAEEVVASAKATKDAADRLLVQIDELIRPLGAFGSTKEAR